MRACRAWSAACCLRQAVRVCTALLAHALPAPIPTLQPVRFWTAPAAAVCTLAAAARDAAFGEHRSAVHQWCDACVPVCHLGCTPPESAGFIVCACWAAPARTSACLCAPSPLQGLCLTSCQQRRCWERRGQQRRQARQCFSIPVRGWAVGWAAPCGWCGSLPRAGGGARLQPCPAPTPSRWTLVLPDSSNTCLRACRSPVLDVCRGGAQRGAGGDAGCGRRGADDRCARDNVLARGTVDPPAKLCSSRCASCM